MYSILNKLLLIVVVVSTCLVSCGSDDEAPTLPNEEELITTLRYVLNSADGETVVLEFKDLDGDGGNDPVVTVENLKANTTYAGELVLLNETVNPAESISEEVEEEAAEHQFFFTVSDANLTVTYDDVDASGNPVGLKTQLTTGAASTGNLTIILKHEPVKTASGVASGDLSNAGGETDIEVTFSVQIL